LHEPSRAGGLGGARDRRRRLGAHAVVLLPGGRLGHAIRARDVCQQVHHGVRPVERAPQRRLVEHVGLDGARPEALEPLAAARGARHPLTRWPAASSSRTARRPMTPVDPVITISFMLN